MNPQDYGIYIHYLPRMLYAHNILSFGCTVQTIWFRQTKQKCTNLLISLRFAFSFCWFTRESEKQSLFKKIRKLA